MSNTICARVGTRCAACLALCGTVVGWCRVRYRALGWGNSCSYRAYGLLTALALLSSPLCEVADEYRVPMTDTATALTVYVFGVYALLCHDSPRCMFAVGVGPVTFGTHYRKYSQFFGCNTNALGWFGPANTSSYASMSFGEFTLTITGRIVAEQDAVSPNRFAHASPIGSVHKPGLLSAISAMESTNISGHSISQIMDSISLRVGIAPTIICPP
jgi:hypothetical protein